MCPRACFSVPGAPFVEGQGSTAPDDWPGPGWLEGKVAGSFTSLGTGLGCGFGLLLGCEWEATDWCFSCGCFSLSFCLSSL